MADIINLRQWKKHKARERKEDKAEQNRITSSIPGRKKRQMKEIAHKQLLRLEDKKLDGRQEKPNSQKTKSDTTPKN